VQALTDRLVFVKVNGWEDTLMAKSRGVSGYPTLILLTSGGEEVDRIPGFAPPQEFVTNINDFLAGRGTLDDLKLRWASFPDSLSLLLQIGDKYQYRGLGPQAESCYSELLLRDPGNAQGHSAAALHSMAMVAYSGGRDHYDSAVARFQAVASRFPATEEALDALTWVPYLLAQMGRYEEALAGFEKFKADHPTSPEIDWVNRQMEETKRKMGAAPSESL
jgi:tetratricopeptide (TPR) repeat protein